MGGTRVGTRRTGKGLGRQKHQAQDTAGHSIHCAGLALLQALQLTICTLDVFGWAWDAFGGMYCKSLSF